MAVSSATHPQRSATSLFSVPEQGDAPKSHEAANNASRDELTDNTSSPSPSSLPSAEPTAAALDHPDQLVISRQLLRRARAVHHGIHHGRRHQSHVVFHALQQCDHAEAVRLRTVYCEAFGVDLQVDLQKAYDGRGRATEAWRRRIELALRGVRDRAENAAEYAAVTLWLAIHRFGVDEKEITAVLEGLNKVSSDGRRVGSQARDVAMAYKRWAALLSFVNTTGNVFGGDRDRPLGPTAFLGCFSGEPSLQNDLLGCWSLSKPVRRLARLVLNNGGVGFESPAGVAIRIHKALEGKVVGRGPANPEAILKSVLDPMPDTEHRASFVRAMLRAYGEAYGDHPRDDGALDRDALNTDVASVIDLLDLVHDTQALPAPPTASQREEIKRSASRALGRWRDAIHRAQQLASVTKALDSLPHRAIEHVDEVLGHAPPCVRMSLPGTDQPWDAEAAAKFIYRAIHKVPTPKRDQELIAEIFYGLPKEEREKVAQAFVARSERARTRVMSGLTCGCASPEPQEKSGEEAVETMRRRLSFALGSKIFIEVSAYLSNTSGRLEAHDVLKLGDHDAVLQMLHRMSPEQQTVVDGALRERYSTGLRDLVQRRLHGSKERLALQVLLTVHRAPGERDWPPTEAHYRAFKVHEAISGWRNDSHALFRLLEQCDKSEVQELSEAFKQLYGKDLEGALLAAYSGIHRNRGACKERIIAALKGVQSDREAAIHYAASSLFIAGQNNWWRGDKEDIVAVLSTLNQTDAEGRNITPTAAEVAAAYRGVVGRHGWSLCPLRAPGDLRKDLLHRRLPGPVQNLVHMVLDDGGRALTSPQGLAEHIRRVLRGQFVGLEPHNREAVLNRLLSEAGVGGDRHAFFEELRRNYGGAYGEGTDDVEALRRDLIAVVGEWASEKRGIRSRAVTLLDQEGVLTTAQRLYMALHVDPLCNEQEAAEVLRVVRNLSEVKKVRVQLEYAELKGEPIDLAAGKNPLAQDLHHLKKRDHWRAEQFLTLLPCSKAELEAHLTQYFAEFADPNFKRWIDKGHGSIAALAEAWFPKPSQVLEMMQVRADRLGSSFVTRWLMSWIVGDREGRVRRVLRQLRSDVDYWRAAEKAGTDPMDALCNLRHTYSELLETILEYLDERDSATRLAAKITAFIVAAVAVGILSVELPPILAATPAVAEFGSEITMAALLMTPMVAFPFTDVLTKTALLGRSYGLFDQEVLDDLLKGVKSGAAIGRGAALASLLPWINLRIVRLRDLVATARAGAATERELAMLEQLLGLSKPLPTDPTIARRVTSAASSAFRSRNEAIKAGSDAKRVEEDGRMPPTQPAHSP